MKKSLGSWRRKEVLRTVLVKQVLGQGRDAFCVMTSFPTMFSGRDRGRVGPQKCQEGRARSDLRGLQAEPPPPPPHLTFQMSELWGVERGPCGHCTQRRTSPKSWHLLCRQC